jgi:hypothetical protein
MWQTLRKREEPYSEDSWGVFAQARSRNKKMRILNNNLWFLGQAKEENIDVSFTEKERQETIKRDEIIRLLKLQVSCLRSYS